MDETDIEQRVRAVLKDADPDDIPVAMDGLVAREVTRAIIKVLHRRFGAGIADEIGDEIMRRQEELVGSEHPWEHQLGQELQDGDLWDVWPELDIKRPPAS